MRKILGLILAAVGLVFGHAAYQNAPTHREDQLAEVTRILTNPGVGTAGSASVAKLNQPKSAPLPAAAPAAVATSSDTESVQVAAAGPAPVALPSATWQTSVAAEAARPGSTAAVTSASPGDGSARRELVRSLQTELRRVGCFSGEATGNWTSKSKRALATFIERVNASLPVEQPDYIQLTLLQGQSGAVCGNCPKGQSQTGDGRCLPSAILAQDETKSRVTAPETTQTAPAREARLAKQRVETASAEAVEELPWANKPARRVEQLSGRMSVGGPVTANQPPSIDSNLETGVVNDEQAAPAADDTAATADIAPGANKRAPQELAALTGVPSPQRAALEPKARAFASKSNFARPQRAAARPQKVRTSSNVAPRRSVQNLFTHPLGRL